MLRATIRTSLLRRSSRIAFGRAHNHDQLVSPTYSRLFASETKVTQYESNQTSYLNTEDYLLTKGSPFAYISSKINPAVMRAYMDYRGQTYNPALLRIIKLTEKILLVLDKNSSKKAVEYKYLPEKIQSTRNEFASKMITSFSKIENDAELKAFAACLTIANPPTRANWLGLDKVIHDDLNKYEMDTGLMCAYALIDTAKRYPFYRLKFKTPNAMLRRYMDQKHGLKKKTSRDAVNMFDSGSTSEADFSNEIFAPIASSVTRSFMSIETLGLQSILLTHCLRSSKLTKHELNEILEDFSRHCEQVLSSIHSPIKLNALAVLWSNLPLLRLPNFYTVYKMLYEQVLYSITAEPLQLLHQEELICTLLESMHQARFKNLNLIKAVSAHLATRGLDQQYALRLFKTLVELDCGQYAVPVLEQFIDTSANQTIDKLLFNTITTTTTTNSANNHGLSTSATNKMEYATSYIALTEEGNEHLYKLLANSDSSRHYKTIELLLALLCYNRCNKQTKFYKLLELIELDVLQNSIDSLSMHNAVLLLKQYAQLGRCHTGLISRLEHNILHFKTTSANGEKLLLATLSNTQLVSIISSIARLNTSSNSDNSNQSVATILATELSNQLLHNLTKSSSGLTANSVNFTYVQLQLLALNLWSMAALRLLTLEYYYKSKRLLQTYFKTNKISTSGSKKLPIKTRMQLASVQIEVDQLEQFERNNEQTRLNAMTNTGSTDTPAAGASDDASADYRDDAGASGGSRRNGSSAIRSNVEDLIELNNDNNFNSSSASNHHTSTSSGNNTNTAEYFYSTSLTHKDISNVLNSLYIPHSNEVLVNGAYIADIVINASDMHTVTHAVKALPLYKNIPTGVTLILATTNTDMNTCSDSGASKGIIVEFDGRFHYDTYLNQPLGHTRMKRRHLQGLGYKLVTIPYWSYNLRLQPEQKKTVILNHLRSVVTLQS